jgi:Asp-tRNA(Asn)/Glu-tRNA(Gln) amidotransferase A subunit family amidase
MVMPTTSFSMI